MYSLHVDYVTGTFYINKGFFLTLMKEHDPCTNRDVNSADKEMGNKK